MRSLGLLFVGVMPLFACGEFVDRDSAADANTNVVDASPGAFDATQFDSGIIDAAIKVDAPPPLDLCADICPRLDICGAAGMDCEFLCDFTIEVNCEAFDVATIENCAAPPALSCPALSSCLEAAPCLML